MSFSIVFGSCSFGRSYATWDAMRDAGPLFFAHLGDLHYGNISTDDVPQYRRRLRQHFLRPEVQRLLATSAFVYTHGDHDSGPDDHHMGTAGFEGFKRSALTAYSDLIPHYPFSQPSGEGWHTSLAQSFTIGRVRFVLPDLYSQRARGVSPTTILGDGRVLFGLATWNQKAWLLDELARAKSDGIALVVLLSSSTWLGRVYDGWQHRYEAEQREIAALVGSADAPEVLVLNGDPHHVGFDDGFGGIGDVSGGTARIPSLTSSQLDSPRLTGAGPYSWLEVPMRQTAGERKFVQVAFDDTGGARVQWTALAHDDLGQPILGPVSSSDAAPTVSLTATAATVTESDGAVDVPLGKSWLGECSVTYQTVDGTATAGKDYVSSSGTIVMGPNRTSAVLRVPILARPGTQGTRSFSVALTSSTCDIVAPTSFDVSIQ